MLLWLACHRQLALKALNERLRSVPAGTSWPPMEDDVDVESGHVSSAASGHVESPSSTLPVATDVSTGTPDTPAAVSTASSTTSETHDQHQ